MSENNSDIIYVIKIIIFIFTNVSYEHYDGSDSKQVNKEWGDMGTAEPQYRLCAVAAYMLNATR